MSLTLLGYKVQKETSPRKALQLLQENLDQFDLLITDEVMPEMTGSELAQHILQNAPCFPVIICSGFLERFTAEDAKRIGVKATLDKPVELGDLVATIRSALS